MKLKQIFKPIPLNKELSWCIFPFYFLCFSCCIPQQQQSRSTSVGWAASFQSWVQWMTHALFNQTPNALCCKTDEELLRKWAERKCKMEKSHQVVIFYPPPCLILWRDAGSGTRTLLGSPSPSRGFILSLLETRLWPRWHTERCSVTEVGTAGGGGLVEKGWRDQQCIYVWEGVSFCWWKTLNSINQFQKCLRFSGGLVAAAHSGVTGVLL